MTSTGDLTLYVLFTAVISSLSLYPKGTKSFLGGLVSSSFLAGLPAGDAARFTVGPDAGFFGRDLDASFLEEVCATALKRRTYDYIADFLRQVKCNKC